MLKFYTSSLTNYVYYSLEKKINIVTLLNSSTNVFNKAIFLSELPYLETYDIDLCRA